ncbi:MAG: cob(I)yrinic acid a,c-diamide adenosyltransferase [Prevotellaceae bacterium]|jgi:cob(I)alamin adenosyltransferase|nr:cob(I)yrinic acid a,c-diamide adenosyltransferase [Prevotellaceae bacterium]
MKIYTKTGDKGTTTLVGGKRVCKSDKQLDAYGTIDELNSFLGLLRAKLTDDRERQQIFIIQNSLFSVGAQLASDPEKPLIDAAKVDPQWIIDLEEIIDQLDLQLPKIKYFIIYGDNELSALCHVCRAVARRAERAIILANEDAFFEEQLTMYINRLSDFLFTFARYLAAKDSSINFFWKK